MTDKMPDEIWVFPNAASIGDKGFTVTKPEDGYQKYTRADAAAILIAGLESIASNSCCDKCQEAKLVAQSTLDKFRADRAAEKVDVGVIVNQISGPVSEWPVTGLGGIQKAVEWFASRGYLSAPVVPDWEIEFLGRVNDLVFQDLLETPDEQILAEAKEDGIDVEKECVRIKGIVDKARAAAPDKQVLSTASDGENHGN